MIALLQRVDEAAIDVNGKRIASIDKGLMVLFAVEKGDTEKQVDRMVDRILGYRVFEDNQGKMNLSLLDTQGELLLVPQFTLAAETQKGMRPSFSSAASPEAGYDLFLQVVENARAKLGKIQAGQFGAEMKVSLVNNGPVTFWLQVPSG